MEHHVRIGSYVLVFLDAGPFVIHPEGIRFWQQFHGGVRCRAHRFPAAGIHLADSRQVSIGRRFEVHRHQHRVEHHVRIGSYVLVLLNAAPFVIHPEGIRFWQQFLGGVRCRAHCFPAAGIHLADSGQVSIGRRFEVHRHQHRLEHHN